MRRLCLNCIVVLALCAPALGAVIRVPEDYPSVLAGVDAAVAGDSVLVGPGTWTHREPRAVYPCGSYYPVTSTMYLRPGITVIGIAGADATILDGGEEATSAVYTVEHLVDGMEVTRVVGFTITGGGTGIGAGCASPLELRSCRIVDNARSGIEAREQTLALTDCVIVGNENDQLGGLYLGALRGIDVNVTCEGCTFAENVGPGLRVSASAGLNSVILRDCVFRDHALRGAVIGDAAVTVERCHFLRNKSPDVQVGPGGGLYLTRTEGRVSFSTFAYDSAASGGGAGSYLGSMTFENNTFAGCHGALYGGALTFSAGNAAMANIFANTTGRRGAVAGGPPAAGSGCNLFWNNPDGDYFGNWPPAATDIHADPLFCDPVILDFTLNASSPAAPANSPVCGLIGAWDVGCGAVALERESWGRIKGRYHRGEGSAP